jgi:negative regulator of flagellin synthesis FlgM
MKVNQSGSVWRLHAYQQKPSPQADREKTVKGQDQVQISDEAKAMLTEQKQGIVKSGEISASRAERIERIKAQIEGGTYQVDAPKVAERVFDFWFRT